ncbi:YhjD/YihY/BrkB family envelope integrity protein [Halopseudomonas pachastrellae]|nr:YhjD/YihY/BrkB family envelope integrity protein [Halopseudomonas pachastrellae]
MPRQLNQYLHFGRYLARRFIEDNCIKNAAALTYTTLFAVVPVMTVAYAMLAAIPAFDQVGGQVEAFIFKNFSAGSGAALQRRRCGAVDDYRADDAGEYREGL